MLEVWRTLKLHRVDRPVRSGQTPQPRYRVSEKTPGAIDEVAVEGRLLAGVPHASLTPSANVSLRPFLKPPESYCCISPCGI